MEGGALNQRSECRKLVMAQNLVIQTQICHRFTERVSNTNGYLYIGWKGVGILIRYCAFFFSDSKAIVEMKFLNCLSIYHS